MKRARRLWLAIGLIAIALSAASAVVFARPSVSPERAAVAMDAPAFGAYLGPCNTTADCQQGLSCQSYKQYGLRCTKSCETDQDCGAPSKGCSRQHRCSMPGATSGHPRR